MESVAILLDHCRQELRRAAAVAPEREQHLCSLLLCELASLEVAVAAGNQPVINRCITNEQQLFGRNFLSGKTGESAEVAFNQMSRARGHGAAYSIIQADGYAAAQLQSQVPR